MGVLAGIACGLLAAAPLALLLGVDTPAFRHGLAAVGGAFLLMQGALLGVSLWRPEELLPFGALSVTTFLLVVVAATVRRELRR